MEKFRGRADSMCNLLSTPAIFSWDFSNFFICVLNIWAGIPHDREKGCSSFNFNICTPCRKEKEGFSIIKFSRRVLRLSTLNHRLLTRIIISLTLNLKLFLGKVTNVDLGNKVKVDCLFIQSSVPALFYTWSLSPFKRTEIIWSYFGKASGIKLFLCPSLKNSQDFIFIITVCELMLHIRVEKSTSLNLEISQNIEISRT